LAILEFFSPANVAEDSAERYSVQILPPYAFDSRREPNTLIAHRGKFVAYYRVSTTEQGRSGLGLEAQKEAVARWLDGGSWKLIASFTEIESGKRVKRPELAKALALSKKYKATLLIARLDRLARNVHFISGLMEAKVKFVACDMPEATPFMLHIYAAVAQEEARAIGARTKAALAAAKARGVRLGSYGATVLAPRMKAEAAQRANALAPMLRELKERGLSLRAIAGELAKREVPTPNGGKWHAQSVRNLLRYGGA
jgi:DNA invertase Pin-like site-specific DNA recombinase